MRSFLFLFAVFYPVGYGVSVSLLSFTRSRCALHSEILHSTTLASTLGRVPLLGSVFFGSLLSSYPSSSLVANSFGAFFSQTHCSPPGCRLLRAVVVLINGFFSSRFRTSPPSWTHGAVQVFLLGFPDDEVFSVCSCSLSHSLF